MLQAQLTISPPTVPGDLQCVRDFFAEQAEAIGNAAELLGGSPWRTRVNRLRAELAETRRLTRPIRAGLVTLHRLLTLQYVDDPDSDEVDYFAAINPADPIVEAICLLSDRLQDVLNAIALPDIPAQGQPDNAAARAA